MYLFRTPFLISPKGEKIYSTPSPVGEGWEGGKNCQIIIIFIVTNAHKDRYY
jgi:hypothetical protein